MTQLHVFTNESDWFVAESAEHAQQLCIEHYGGLFSDEEFGTFEELADSSMLTISYEDAPEDQESRCKHTCRQWADVSMPGLLASIDY